ncbi:hypothetical protein GGR58DRAFT_522722 [Xylaria digitata]|nr:hypothetical protein GGR58DRAFT_522722 [Xylaria digitata]
MKKKTPSSCGSGPSPQTPRPPRFTTDPQASQLANFSNRRNVLFAIEFTVQLPNSPTFKCHTLGWRTKISPIQQALKQVVASNWEIKGKAVNDFKTWAITENRTSDSRFDISSPKLAFHDRDWISKFHDVYRTLERTGCQISQN